MEEEEEEEPAISLLLLLTRPLPVARKSNQRKGEKKEVICERPTHTVKQNVTQTLTKRRGERKKYIIRLIRKQNAPVNTTIMEFEKKSLNS